MNPGLERLQKYPFEKLAQLFAGTRPPPDKSAIDLSIGEPKHPTPEFILRALADALPGAARYPATRGSPELRAAIAGWLARRYRLPEGSISAERHVLPVNGTREALFAFAQCMLDARANDVLALLPNPFYQIYEGAVLLAGAAPWYVNCTETSDFMPDFASVPPEIWRRCRLLYLCSPANPTGMVLDHAALVELLGLADRYDFIIAADECYSEIYLDEDRPPPGLLEAAASLGRTDYRRCIVFHSLSKRSNAPGMRSGFVAGDAELIAAFYRYRTYHGCAMAPYTQAASIAAWQDEAHVKQNRAAYREKFDAVLDILAPALKVRRPRAGFYLWPETPQPDTDFARGLFARQNVTVLPGTFLSRPTPAGDPGARRVRIALVPPLKECVEAARRIRAYVESL